MNTAEIEWSHIPAVHRDGFVRLFAQLETENHRLREERNGFRKKYAESIVDKLVDAAEFYAEMVAKYGPGEPSLVDLREQLERALALLKHLAALNPNPTE